MKKPASADADRRIVLARRARFLAATLAGVGCGSPPPPQSPPAGVVITTPAPGPKTSAPEESEPVPEKLAAPDRDRDGVPDDEDACPDDPGTDAEGTGDRGCPIIEPMICLSMEM